MFKLTFTSYGMLVESKYDTVALALQAMEELASRYTNRNQYNYTIQPLQ